MFNRSMNAANPLTQVVVFFMPQQEATKVHLVHSGWAGGDEWEQARLWFDNVWRLAFEALERRVNSGDTGQPYTTMREPGTSAVYR